MSFASGLKAGSSVAGDWVDNYKTAKTGAIKNKLFKTAHDIQQEREANDAEGNKIMQEGMDFASMTGDEITNSMLQSITQAGGKIDDQTYAIAYQMGNMFKEKKNEISLFEDKKALNDAKRSNYYNMIDNRNNSNTRANKLFNRKKNGGAKEEEVSQGKFENWAKDNGFSLKGRSKTQLNKLYNNFVNETVPYKRSSKKTSKGSSGGSSTNEETHPFKNGKTVPSGTETKNGKWMSDGTQWVKI